MLLKVLLEIYINYQVVTNSKIYKVQVLVKYMKIKIPREKLTREYINQLAKENSEQTDETRELEERVLKEFMKQKRIVYEIIQNAKERLGGRRYTYIKIPMKQEDETYEVKKGVPIILKSKSE